MKRAILTFLAVVGMVFSFSLISPISSAGALSPSDCEFSFLGFKPWYAGLSAVKNDKCVVKSPGQDITIAAFVWTIVLNILFDLFLATGMIATGFIIYGGYLYILARGEVGRVEKGKKTLIRAITGLIIAILASIIVNTILGALGA